MKFHKIIVMVLLAASSPAHAEFIINSAILEFTSDGPRQQDIELISKSETSDYVVSETLEVVEPGSANESRVPITDPEKGGLMVTPDKMVLAAGERKLLRFVMLREPDAQEHIYRVTVKPVIKGVENNSKVGLKVLIGYEVLVIVRPKDPAPSYEVARSGNKLTVTNNGNTNVLFQNGHQCKASENCKVPPVFRVYPQQRAQIDLPLDKAVTYTVWDGTTNAERHVQ